MEDRRRPSSYYLTNSLLGGSDLMSPRRLDMVSPFKDLTARPPPSARHHPSTHHDHAVRRHHHSSTLQHHSTLDHNSSQHNLSSRRHPTSAQDPDDVPSHSDSRLRISPSLPPFHVEPLSCSHALLHRSSKLSSSIFPVPAKSSSPSQKHAVTIPSSVTSSTVPTPSARRPEIAPPTSSLTLLSSITPAQITHGPGPIVSPSVIPLPMPSHETPTIPSKETPYVAASAAIRTTAVFTARVARMGTPQNKESPASTAIHVLVPTRIAEVAVTRVNANTAFYDSTTQTNKTPTVAEAAVAEGLSLSIYQSPRLNPPPKPTASGTTTNGPTPKSGHQTSSPTLSGADQTAIPLNAETQATDKHTPTQGGAATHEVPPHAPSQVRTPEVRGPESGLMLTRPIRYENVPARTALHTQRPRTFLSRDILPPPPTRSGPTRTETIQRIDTQRAVPRLLLTSRTNSNPEMKQRGNNVIRAPTVPALSHTRPQSMTHHGNLGSRAPTELATARGKLVTTRGDLVTARGDVGASREDLGRVRRETMTGPGDLATARAHLATIRDERRGGPRITVQPIRYPSNTKVLTPLNQQGTCSTVATPTVRLPYLHIQSIQAPSVSRESVGVCDEDEGDSRSSETLRDIVLRKIRGTNPEPDPPRHAPIPSLVGWSTPPELPFDLDLQSCDTFTAFCPPI